MNRKERRRREAETRAASPGSKDPELREMMQRATGLHRDGRIDQAVAAYEAILAREPRHADALQFMGVAKMQNGHDDEAIGLLKQAVGIDPKNSQAHYNLGLALRAEGKEPKALASFRRAIAVEPRNFEAHNAIAGILLTVSDQLETVEVHINCALENNPKHVPARNNLALLLKARGRLEEAASEARVAVAQAPAHTPALITLGALLLEMGETEEAEQILRNAMALAPEEASVHINLGAALINRGAQEEAEAEFKRALELDLDNSESLSNLAMIRSKQGRQDEAIDLLQRALNLNPGDADAHYNLGNALRGQGKREEAVASYGKVLALKPDYAEAHNNLGNAMKDLGKLSEAVASYHKALTFKPDLPEPHFNLGNAFLELGELDEAVASYHKALAIRPDYAEAWNNFRLAAKALSFSEAQKGQKENGYKKGLSDAVRTTADFAVLEYYLAKFRPHEADKAAQKALAALPRKVDEEVLIDGRDHKPTTPPALADKLIGMLHFGRSGTGLLHSLVDSHPEVSTLPSIYLRGFFNAGVWNKISADGWRRLPERFADEFAVLFDANSPRSTPGMVGENSSLLGRKEGMTTVGENRNESLSLDRDQFCAEALRLMENLTNVDPALFLLVVHAAFEKVLGTKTKKHTALYHIHNPDDFSKLNFLRYAPDARLLMMVREPVQSCEAFVHKSFLKNNYDEFNQAILSMLFAIDQVAFRMQDSVGVRLEDLKTKPEATLHSLCKWMGIEDSPTLYQMTAQGKKWWGDPSSPDYDTDKAMDPFDTKSIQRSVGSIFSERDQFVLGTLFYPFSVRFGYREPDPAAFEKDLKEIRPLLDELLDFERVMADRANIDRGQFRKNGDYQLFHAGLVDRWQVLGEFGDYPHMVESLPIP